MPLTPYAEALARAAEVAHAAGRPEEAATVLKLAIGCSGDDGLLLYHLGHLQHGLGQYPESEQALRRSVALDPTRANAFNDLAATLFVLGRDAEALGFIRQALVLDPALAEAEETDSIWLLRNARFSEGWRKYEARNRTAESAKFVRNFTQPQWYGEPIHGRTILLHAEQGLGDSLQFCRYAPLVAARGARVLLEVHPGLRGVMTGLRGVSRVLERGEPLPHFDLHCPLLSLPLAFGTDLDSIPAQVPYITPDPDHVWRWRARLGPRERMRIGIAWSGNPIHKEDRRRSLPLSQFAHILAPHQGREFHVLQSVVRDSDKPVLETLPGVHDHSGLLADFSDTAALVSLMDLVICVDTSVGHLAGAMGWPTWVLVQAIPDWRWMWQRDDSPWYPGHWLFRQKRVNDWDPVLQEVARQLDDMLT